MSDRYSETAPEDLPVGVGVQVEVELFSTDGQRERLTIQVVRDNTADFEAGLLSVNTPLAQALLGKRAGREVAYNRGDIHRVRILRVTPGRKTAPGDAAERRQALTDQALREVARTNAEIFAASYTSKWGGYDAGSREEEAGGM
jgi:hypothetical protein